MNITFKGGAREIGGSCTVVETDDARIALDYGIKLDEGLSHDMPVDLDAVFVSHAHLDHSGNLFNLITDENKKTTIIGSKATRDITTELLRDLIKINKFKSTPLSYSRSDLSTLAEMWLTRKRVAMPGVEISLYPAGHVLGANMVQLKIKGKSLLYTGDFCIHPTEILDGANPETIPKEPDVLVMESTYGGIVRPIRTKLLNELFEKIIETMERRGNILIPAFAFHRLQEMCRRIDLAMITKILPKYNAYYISGLAHKITHYFNEYKYLLSKQVSHQARPFNFKRVRRLKRTEKIKEPAIVICTSGFGHAGASFSLVHQWAGNADDTIIINTGYLPPNSPLIMAKEGKIIDNGESIDVNADVTQIELSGHADQKQLIDFVKTLKPKETFLVHGNLDQAQLLSEKIKRYTDVQIPNINETFGI